MYTRNGELQCKPFSSPCQARGDGELGRTLEAPSLPFQLEKPASRNPGIADRRSAQPARNIRLAWGRPCDGFAARYRPRAAGRATDRPTADVDDDGHSIKSPSEKNQSVLHRNRYTLDAAGSHSLSLRRLVHSCTPPTTAADFRKTAAKRRRFD